MNLYCLSHCLWWLRQQEESIQTRSAGEVRRPPWAQGGAPRRSRAGAVHLELLGSPGIGSPDTGGGHRGNLQSRYEPRIEPEPGAPGLRGQRHERNQRRRLRRRVSLVSQVKKVLQEAKSGSIRVSLGGSQGRRNLLPQAIKGAFDLLTFSIQSKTYMSVSLYKWPDGKISSVPQMNTSK